MLVARYGPIEACRICLGSDITTGLVVVALRHGDTTVEQIVLQDRFAELFTREEVELATANLDLALRTLVPEIARRPQN